MKANRHTSGDPLAILRRALRDAERHAQAARSAADDADEKVRRLEQAISVLEGTAAAPPRSAAKGKSATNRVIHFLPRDGTIPLYQQGETMHGYAARIIKTAGRPLHIKDILARMMDGGYPSNDMKVLRGSLTKTLDRKVALTQGFTKPSAATYGVTAEPSTNQPELIAENGD